MPTQTRDVSPGQHERQVQTTQGQTLEVPSGWVLLAPGDAALSRRVKAEGPCWCVKEKRGRKVFSRGIWAPRERIERLTRELSIERENPAYQRKLDAGRERRAQEQRVYAGDFEAAVLGFLSFAERHRALARQLAQAIAEHAAPVGSGTVARTRRIPIEQRAEAATIAWLRHQTTGYDGMTIPRVKGMRREVRRMLAQRSRELLAAYRQGKAVDAALCPLARALCPLARALCPLARALLGGSAASRAPGATVDAGALTASRAT